MATSPLFGWEEPDDTDLVKDGAAAMRTLGNAIDTSMGDLLGGTSGQILSKASATDMDFAWITNDVGDITSVGVTSPITGGGTSGAVTIAIQDATTAQKGAVQLSDSTSTTSSILASTPTAVKSAYDLANTANTAVTTNNFFAGKNKIINGDFGIWQRGTTFSNPVNGDFNADRWKIGYTGTGATRTLTQQTFSPGSAPVAGYEGQYFLRYARTVAGTGATVDSIRQTIEDVRTFAGQTVTMSFWMKVDSGTASVTVRAEQVFGGGGSANVTADATPVTATTSWERYSATINIPSVSGKTIGSVSTLLMQLRLPINTIQTYDIWGIQLEAGSVATAFQTATGTIQGELAACQRYYYRQTASNTDTAFGTSTAITSATSAFTIFKHPITMRVAPTSLDFSTIRVIDNSTGTQYATSAAALGYNGLDYSAAIWTITGATGGRFAYALANNSTSAFVGFSAEL